ncbi:MAG: PQQ-dependent sugar dehydrogenase [Parvularculaceae bacterium]|nr:PQQ-dependent sugar dehydrogenase [Parvularculaceae bacterium]
MSPFSRVSLAALAAALAACGGPAGEARKTQTTLAAAAPEGDAAFKVETLAEGLVNPWSLAFLPDGSILVTERDGKLRVIRDGALVETPVAGVPAPYVKSQGGLFDVMLHPDFATNRTIFLSYAAGAPDANATRVISATFDGAALTDIKTIFETATKKDTPVHYGGRLALLPDRTLLITVGDGFNYREKAQDLSNGLGKIARVNLDGSIPADNPFAGREGALPEIFSYGHRNQQGLAVDPATGTIFATEHGPMGGDELNIIEAGANYGWPIATYGLDYSGAQISPFTEYEGTKQPEKYWVPSIGPSGLAIYQGDLFAGWKGDLLVGALAKTALHRLDVENGKIVGEERYLEGERIRDVREGPDGAIYVTTEDHDGAPIGRVLRLTPAQ